MSSWVEGRGYLLYITFISLCYVCKLVKMLHVTYR